MRLRYTLPALADLDSILTYIASRSPKGATRVHQRIRDTVQLLAEFPGVGPRTLDPGIRRIVARPYPYVIFYEVAENEIIIHAIRHGYRDPSTMPGSVS